MSETYLDLTPSVLFVCDENGGKSQLAAALMRQIAGDTVQVHSAGTNPARRQRPVRSGPGRGRLDITGEYPNLIDPELLRTSTSSSPWPRSPVDAVPGTRFEMGHRRALRTRHRRYRAHAPVRDDIADRVADLLDRMQTRPS